MTPNYINLRDMEKAPKDGEHIILLFIVEGKWFLSEGFWNGSGWCGIDPTRLINVDFTTPARWARRDDFIERFKGD